VAVSASASEPGQHQDLLLHQPRLRSVMEAERVRVAIGWGYVSEAAAAELLESMHA
jgi:hypothetical protein